LELTERLANVLWDRRLAGGVGKALLILVSGSSTRESSLLIRAIAIEYFFLLSSRYSFQELWNSEPESVPAERFASSLTCSRIALKTVASSSSKSSKVAPGSILSRYDGEELGAVAKSISSVDVKAVNKVEIEDESSVAGGSGRASISGKAGLIGGEQVVDVAGVNDSLISFKIGLIRGE